MKPHPHIRKTIKWSGAALTVLLVVVWIGSGWWQVFYLSPADHGLWFANGGIWIYRAYWPPFARFIPTGWHAGSLWDERFFWWLIWHGTSARWCLFIPTWLPLILVSIPTALAFRLDTLARSRVCMNLCVKCHYDRTGLAGDAVCPECGTGSGTA